MPAAVVLPDDAALGLLQHVILQSDATVVRLLEACFRERICTAGLEQTTTPALPTDVELQLTGEETVLRRATLLQGSRTGRNYVYAETSIVLDRLGQRLREGLLGTTEPIGHLLIAGRVETFREPVRSGHASAGPRAASFGLVSSDTLLFRSYRVIAHGRPVMLITEHFPPSLFVAGPQAAARDGAAAQGGW